MTEQRIMFNTRMYKYFHQKLLLISYKHSLLNYRCSGQPIPEEVLATAKFTSQKTLYMSNCDATGLLCLALPTNTSFLKEPNNLIEILQVIF
jgi:hypothetical protein